MKDFKRSGGRFKFNRGGSGFSDRPRFGGSSRGRDGGFGGPKQMFSATCGECGNSCEVPFRPSGERAVFCRDCFSKKDNNSGFHSGNRGRSFSRNTRDDDRNSRPSSNDNDFKFAEIKKQLLELNVKFDKLISGGVSAKSVSVDQNTPDLISLKDKKESDKDVESAPRFKAELAVIDKNKKKKNKKSKK